MTPDPDAVGFVVELERHRSVERQQKIQRYFKHADGDVFIGVRTGQVFTLAKQHVTMPLGEIEKLLDHPAHEARVGAVKIMALQAAGRTTPESRRRELFDLYLRRHDRINNWDLVDLGAWHVVGGYLVDKPREILYELARSEDPWQRRTAIVATMAFVGRGDLADTFRIAEILFDDDHDLIHKATGWLLRTAGTKDRQSLLDFLDRHAAVMPRVALRYAIEHLDQALRARYLAMKSQRR